MNKINVIGTSASGKSTFARALAMRLGYPYIEMDAIYWGPNWSEPTDQVYFENLRIALEKDQWVLDGNYTRTTAIKWKEVDTVIWIDFSYTRTLYQSLSRAIHRLLTKKELWPNTGNRETWSLLFSKDSIVLWMMKNYWKTKRKYELIIENHDYNHIHFVRLQSPRACRSWLRNIQII